MRITSRLVSFVSRRTAWSEGHVFTIAPEQMNVADGLRTAAGMALAFKLEKKPLIWQWGRRFWQLIEAKGASAKWL